MELFGFIIRRKVEVENEWKRYASRVRLLDAEIDKIADMGSTPYIKFVGYRNYNKGAKDALGILLELGDDGK